MEEEDHLNDGLESLKVDTSLGPTSATAIKKEVDSTASTPNDSKNSRLGSLSPDDPKARSDSASTPDGIQLPKVSRKASQKPPRPTNLLTDLPDVTSESCEHFQVIPDCLYGSKALGSTDHDSLDCDCSEEWRDGMNHACGEDSDCINRATKMECVDSNCNCGNECQNQRFQRKQYANVSVIKTEKKGFGLRADTDLQAHEFIFEYIGEVINEPTFRRRAIQYDKEGIRHFYFMSLTKNEFVDATKKGNLGRFCNHSCNPNCYVDKWVVGNKLRMGIFAGRRIQLGEELVFNYNVDRYGADPQPCYCGEPNCIGFIGGKTQTERATKLPDATIEALGIDDSDGWDTAVAKKPRKKKISEDDEDYVNSVQARSLDEKGVTKVMATLMQCKEKWIAVKLLQRIQRSDDDRVRNRVVQMHGYQILKTVLNTFIQDNNVVLQVLDILYQFPRLTKNKIVDSKIESTIQPLVKSEHEDVATESARLLDEWSKLEIAYRIPRKKLDPNAPSNQASQPVNSFEERRGARPEEPLKPTATLPTNTPKGPRSNVPQRNPNFFNSFPRRNRPAPPPLPAGWFATTDERGSLYYYTKTGDTTWQRPTVPAPDAAPLQSNGPSKAQQEQKTLQDIIDSLTKPGIAPGRSASQTPQPASTPTQETKQEKWRSLPIEKQMKIYENTLFPHVKYVLDKFRHKLPKEELKKFAKEISKKLVNSDYKNNRVDNPTSITEKQERKVKIYVKEFLDRAVQKYQEHEKKKVGRASGSDNSKNSQLVINARDTPIETAVNRENGDVAMTDDEEAGATPASADLKRKRNDDPMGSPHPTPSESPFLKRLKESEDDEPSPPPPPPPPPPDGEDAFDSVMAEEETALEEQHVALLQQGQEEEERQRLREAEAALERENELNMLEFQRGGLNNEATSVMTH
ncbi:putative histone-lysine N- H3 lysine-36 specific [Rosellinia necatrix]|uniref:Histone-lysine N-methyltransferase, H3 lysine-36 specific n=1 Tax=Rosellinia necatrix TaxID=77044 RepID=A0A1W2TH51_ROSNE|nr:putative histone-lysine N- H3 lysine-36 specific [Rosellinia necatrix]